MRRVSLLLLGFASLLAPLCAQQASNSNAQPALNTQQADALGQQLFDQSNSTGMVMVVVQNNQTLFRGYGETTPGSGQRPLPNSLLRLCSLSKIFATDLLVKLAADNKLHLNDPLQKFAPPHVLVPARVNRSITLEHLATHTSGLPREVGIAPRGTPHFTFPDYAYRWRWLPKQRLKTTPGTAALYSNIGFDLLGDAIQRAAGESYARLFAERIAQPLGMHETGFTPNAAQCGRLLQGTRDEGECTDTQNSVASAGVYSTATDMTLWLKYLLREGVVAQSQEAQAVYVEPHELFSQQGLDHAGAPTGIGLGWMHILAGPSEIVEKTGGGAGFTTYIALNQANHTAIFVAFTDGEGSNHFNVFKGANNVLLTLCGLPPMPLDPPKPAPKPVRRKPHAPATHS